MLRGRVPILVPGLNDLKRSFFVLASDYGMHPQAWRMVAARDSLCPYKGSENRLLESHTIKMAKLGALAFVWSSSKPGALEARGCLSA